MKLRFLNIHFPKNWMALVLGIWVLLITVLGSLPFTLCLDGTHYAGIEISRPQTRSALESRHHQDVSFGFISQWFYRNDRAQGLEITLQAPQPVQRAESSLFASLTITQALFPQPPPLRRPPIHTFLNTVILLT